ncbi:pimeloyl-ACP methyl ester esterase BioH [Inmirania thermothiophila]|uniref:Carboxylesterase BioH (Pimeloyl-CoA synthesis) n=1 Tax=Inmirania thermothiophila TaxID=1750597 RepID=A0A3N1Y6R4_9GAMM|nr:pimeloyl-ACP methyl ester esterase BioH [Inmirania thermothiophila]ROR34504.1 carboxylesterase BioH (pimeloyl-CoA synthesis) [Inmirania thermothiophila]
MGEAVLPVVALHGWAMSGRVFAPLAARVPGLLALDLPGHGEGGAVPAGGVEAWAAAVLARAPRRAWWLGWSLGGMVALAAAAQAPERVAGLVLVAASPRFVRGPDWPRATAPEVLEGFAAELARDHAATLRRFLALQVRGAPGARPLARRLAAAMAPPRPEALAAGLDILRGADLRGALAALAVPAAVVLGGRDALVPAAVAADLAALAPAARVTVLEDAAHAPLLSHPEAVAAGLEGLRCAAA